MSNRFIFGAIKRPVSVDEAKECISSLDGLMRDMHFDVSSTGGLNRNYSDAGTTNVHLMSNVFGSGESSRHVNQAIIETPLALADCGIPHYIAAYFNSLDYRMSGDLDGSNEEHGRMVRKILGSSKPRL